MILAEAGIHFPLPATTCRYEGMIGDDRVGQVAFGLLQLYDLVFHRVAANDPICHHAASLTNAMRPVDRLSLHRWIPPRVKDEHVVRRRQIQAVAARNAIVEMQTSCPACQD